MVVALGSVRLKKVRGHCLVGHGFRERGAVGQISSGTCDSESCELSDCHREIAMGRSICIKLDEEASEARLCLTCPLSAESESGTDQVLRKYLWFVSVTEIFVWIFECSLCFRVCFDWLALCSLGENSNLDECRIDFCFPLAFPEPARTAFVTYSVEPVTLEEDFGMVGTSL